MEPMDQYEQLKQHQTDHLILLVGGNPLPNYVAARLLGKHSGLLYLVHTQKSFVIAQRLAQCLSQEAEGQYLAGDFKDIQFVQVDQNNPHDIFSKVHKLAKEDGISASSTVGLNYTSGNRPMSVHAYSAVVEARSNARFSYLDAGQLQMLVHDAHRTSWSFRADSFLNMRLETLLQLQGLQEDPSKPCRNVPLQPRLAAVLADLHSKDEGVEAWLNWRRNGSDGWKKLPQNQPGLEKVEEALKELCDGNPTPDRVAHLLGHKTLPSTAQWWKGGWLEDYVLIKLQDAIAGRNDTCDAVMGVHRRRVDHSDRDFDLDIVVMRRYQLFVFSCIVSGHIQPCKDHLMEAYVRARQAGGDEARVGLVCIYNNAQALQKEIAGDLDAGGKIRVFGQKDLLSLTDRIREWLDNQP